MSTTTESRSLVFADGSSNKFWKIELEGSSHSVTFGRVGTNGQTQTKEFASEAEARKSYDKLVAEKLKKGYTEEQGTAAPTTKAPAKPKATKTTAVEAAETKKEPAAVPPSAAPVPMKPVDINVTRSIALHPLDWYRAAYKKLPPRKREEPKAFDRHDCLQKLSKLDYFPRFRTLNWATLSLPETLSREEAQFWLLASSIPFSPNLMASIEKADATAFSTIEEIETYIKEAPERLSDHSAQMIAALVSPCQFLQVMQLKPSKGARYDDPASLTQTLARAYRRHVIPYLSEDEKEEVRKVIRKRWDPTYKPSSYGETYPPDYYVAAATGMPNEIYQVTSRWEDGNVQGYSVYSDWYQRPQDLVFGLGSAETIASEWDRLKLQMRDTDDVRAFLACTEYSALDQVVKRIVSETNKDVCSELLKTLAFVHAPEVAEPMLRCKLESKMPAFARDWLEQNIALGVAGLLETAAGKGKLAEAALDYLRSVKRNGHIDVIAEMVKALGDSPTAAKIRADVIDHKEIEYVALDEKTSPPWLVKELEAIGKLKTKPVPSWAMPSALPPLPLGDRKLNEKQMGTVVQVLVATPLAQKHPLLAQLREHVPKSARDEFAWRLFQSWQEAGTPPKEKWAMGAIGHLGDDLCIAKLTPLIRNWPGESQHARAVFGLECLRAISSSIALMNLSGIAQKLKFKGLKAKAEQFVDEIAQERGLTKDELQDRVVPDCGLDEQGRRTFSFGPRSFDFVLGGDLKAMVRDEGGKLRGDLPAANAKDDEALATEAIAEWKILKKQIKDVATIQAARLEQAMITGRRWNVDDFQSLLVRHPLMTHLAQKLIWAGFDADGKRVATFRVTEERDFASPDDDSVTLDAAKTVGIVHPLELSEEERERWGQVLGDYEIVAPFSQLGRATYALEPNERTDDDIKRLHGLKLVAPTLVFTLEKLGWIRGIGLDAGCFDEHSKQFPAAGVTAVLNYEGTVGMGYIDPNETLTISAVRFCRGMRKPSGYEDKIKETVLKLGDVPAIVISEVLADMQLLKSKAK